MSAPQMPRRPEVISRTMFSLTNDQWFWETKSLTNEPIASGEGGYEKLNDAIASFFAQQKVAYGLMEKWPSDFGPLQRLQEDQYQINKFL